MIEKKGNNPNSFLPYIENKNEKKGNIPYSLLVIKENSCLFFQKDKGQIRIKLLNLRKFRKMSVLSEYSM